MTPEASSAAMPTPIALRLRCTCWDLNSLVAKLTRVVARFRVTELPAFAHAALISAGRQLRIDSLITVGHLLDMKPALDGFAGDLSEVRPNLVILDKLQHGGSDLVR